EPRDVRPTGQQRGGTGSGDLVRTANRATGGQSPVTTRPGKTTLPESLRQWQKLAGRPGNYFTLPATEEERREVLSALKSALWAAGPEHVGTSLLRLQAHYWRPDFSPA